MARRFDAAARAAYLAALREGVRRGAAARELGFDRHVADGYIAEHADFAAAVLDAETDATELVEEALFQSAVSGNVNAGRLWLERGESRKSQRRDSSPVADFDDAFDPLD